MELHTYPIGIVDHTLGLEGPEGLLAFVEMVDPKGEKDGDGVVRKWDTFRLTEDETLVNDGDGQWYAFPTHDDGWIVKWYDSKSRNHPQPTPCTIRPFADVLSLLDAVGTGVTDNYVIVDIVMKVVDEGS